MYSLSNIAEIIGAQHLTMVSSTHNPKIAHLLTDSRQVLQAESSLFFAFQTDTNDGHRFIGELYAKGVQSFVVTRVEQVWRSVFPAAHFLLVNDTLRALQNLAAHHRQGFSLATIGITGSNGKTVVKEWLFQLLQTDFFCARSPKSYNSQIGVPLSVWQLTAEHTLAIFEAGISTIGEMKHIAPIIAPTIGILTNIGTAHDEGFPSRQAKIDEKIKLFKTANTIIYSSDDEMTATSLRKCYPSARHLTWSVMQKSAADLKVLQKTERTNGQYGLRLVATYKEHETLEIEIPFTDAASVENVLHCCLVMLHLGYQVQTIAERISQLEAVAMRLELKAGINHCILVNDSYNSDLTSLAVALNFLAQNSKNLQKTLIISDILQSGLSQKVLQQTIVSLAARTSVRRIIGIGASVANLPLDANPDIVFEHFENTDAFLRTLGTSRFADEAILIKGARQFGFERIAQRLAQKNHRTILEISLNAIRHNFFYYKKIIPKDTKTMAMVKAAAYGSGGLEVARLLQTLGVDYLAVAYPDEGVELRKGGIELPILVLNPEPASFEVLLRYALEPEIYGLSLLNDFLRQCAQQTATIHLKLDTGMKRLGFETADLPQLTRRLKENPNVRVASVFTHLAASESSAHDTFTQAQVARFNAGFNFIINEIGYKPLAHVLNSSGILRFPEHHKDMVRLGIGLYGLGAQGLQTVSTLKASISQIKQLASGETVGYGRHGIVQRPSRIATISIGYADGLPRKAGNGRFSAMIHGRLAPTIGNVCMDMSMLDVTDIQEAQEGDEVLIFGKELPLQKMAEQLDTIAYEILTGVSGRVKRIYIWE